MLAWTIRGKLREWRGYQRLMDDLPNKIVNHLGLVVDINLLQKDEKYYIEIAIPVSTVPVSCHGGIP